MGRLSSEAREGCCPSRARMRALPWPNAYISGKRTSKQQQVLGRGAGMGHRGGRWAEPLRCSKWSAPTPLLQMSQTSAQLARAHSPHWLDAFCAGRMHILHTHTHRGACLGFTHGRACATELAPGPALPNG